MNPPNEMKGVTLKRKRGRPRKNLSQNPFINACLPQNHILLNQSNGDNALIPPGFEGINGNQPPQQPPLSDRDTNNKVESVLGPVVTGVIESVFDAGYLLSVRVGDSDTNLRGIVFKPGHFVPVSPENDVAPILQMIPRTEVPLPSINHGQRHRGRVNGSSNSNPVTVSPYPVGERGTVVPVVLQPGNLSNGVGPIVEAPPIASQPAHLVSSKPPFDDSIDVAKNTQCGTNLLPNDNSGFFSEQVKDFSKPSLAKPIQAFRSGPQDEHASIPNAFSETKTGKMTELLTAVQENLMEKQMDESQVQEPSKLINQK